MNLTMVTDLCSIGTLFAFVLVCAGVLVLQNKKDIPRGKFKTPYINAKFIMPVLLMGGLVLAFTYNKQTTIDFITNKKQLNNATDIVTSLNPQQLTDVKQHFMATDSAGFTVNNKDLETYLSSMETDTYTTTINALPLGEDLKYDTGFSLFKHKIPMWIFIIITFFITIWTYRANLSLIPLLGLISCLYMMAELGVSNWIGFGIWLLVGLLIYFGYSRKNSKLNMVNN